MLRVRDSVPAAVLAVGLLLSGMGLARAQQPQGPNYFTSGRPTQTHGTVSFYNGYFFHPNGLYNPGLATGLNRGAAVPVQANVAFPGMTPVVTSPSMYTTPGIAYQATPVQSVNEVDLGMTPYTVGGVGTLGGVPVEGGFAPATPAATIQVMTPYTPADFSAMSASLGSFAGSMPAYRMMPDASFARPTGGATVDVRVPADAELRVQGRVMRQTGSVRKFVSPPLDPDRTYTYKVEARWTENGKLMTQSRQITLSSGHHVTVDLRPDEGTVVDQ